jgi:hypothetical protein
MLEENPATETSYNLSIVQKIDNVEHKNFVTEKSINAVYCENHMKHTNTPWAECRVFLKEGGTMFAKMTFSKVRGSAIFSRRSSQKIGRKIRLKLFQTNFTARLEYWVHKNRPSSLN